MRQHFSPKLLTMKNVLLLSGLFMTIAAQAQTTTPQPSIDSIQAPSPAAIAKPAPVPQPVGIGVAGELAIRPLVQRGRMTNLPEDVEGIAIVKICVDSTGQVSEAVLVPEKSTITHPVAIEQILKAARQYRFKPHKDVLQCGNLTFNVQKK